VINRAMIAQEPEAATLSNLLRLRELVHFSFLTRTILTSTHTATPSHRI
jgi:hypothetical protein